MDINKYRRIIGFHYNHFIDQNLSGDKQHIIVSSKLLEGEFLKYKDYAFYCANHDIAAVSEERWEKEIL
jgi:hypothetical protein